MYKILLIMIMCSSVSFTMSGANIIMMTDNFKNGSLKGGTLWKSKSTKAPWKIVNNYAIPSGTIIFDSISTADFKPIQSGVFSLEFHVKFLSGEKSGNNRFTVMLRDSLNGYSGYCATIAQGTSNNSGIEVIIKGKRKGIKRMPAKNSYFFNPNESVKIIFARDNAGKITLTVADSVVMEVVDKQFTRFDIIQFQERCKTPQLIQAIGNITLK